MSALLFEKQDIQNWKKILTYACKTMQNLCIEWRPPIKPSFYDWPCSDK